MGFIRILISFEVKQLILRHSKLLSKYFMENVFVDQPFLLSTCLFVFLLDKRRSSPSLLSVFRTEEDNPFSFPA